VRTAVVMDHPAQQFATGLRLLAAEPSVGLQVYYRSVAQGNYDAGFDRAVRWDIDLLGGYPWAAPPVPVPRATAAITRWLAGQFRATRPDVVVCYGWASPATRAAMACCLLTRTPFLLYGDATWQHAGRSGAARAAVRSAALRGLLALSAGAISTGTFNREFYIRHGMDPRRIRPGVCPADVTQFAAARSAPAAQQAETAGAGSPGAGQEEPLRIGFAGKLIRRKGADELLRAAALLPAAGWQLTVVGDGPELGVLQELSERLAIADRVTFRGFANTTQMPALLAGCDVIVVPSRRDMRVLVTIEAMAAGAAVVVSDATAVWGSGDLVEPGITGLVYPSGDASALAAALGRLIADPGLLSRLRSAGTRRAADYGPEAFAAAMASAVRASATTGPWRRRIV
jgi:glycosyltransferase involved in cell wall biosynthesis